MNEKQPQPSSHTRPEAAADHEREPRPSPRIYVASLSDYNNGVLHGAWVDAARDAPSIHADIQAMLAASDDPGAEEFAIHDYESFGVYQVHEYDTIELVSWIANGIREFGLAFAAWAYINQDDQDRLGDFADAYRGHYESPTAYAEELADDLALPAELAKLPEALQSYVRIDTDALARDLQMSGDIDVVPDPAWGVWVFDART